MTVSITLLETRSVEAGVLYRVKQEITASVDISASVFVFRTDTRLFSHVATVYDMEKLESTSIEEAEEAGDEFYRLDEVTKDWESLDTSLEFSSYNKLRLNSLVDEYEVYTNTFAGTTTTVITSA